MRAMLAAVLGVVAGAPVLAEPRVDDRFTAFEEACLDGYRDPAKRAAAIGAAGWQAVADDADPELEALMGAAREAIADAEKEDDMTGAAAAFARGPADGRLYLVTTEMNMPADAEWKIDLLACHLYDFAATSPLDPQILSDRFAEAPGETVDEPATLVGQMWNVESLEGIWEVRNTFIPEGSPAAAQTGFTGVMLKITSTRE